MLELDHIFVCSPDTARGAVLLERAGFVQNSPNVHPGQGTHNARFFFDNAYLEILGISDEREVRSPIVRPTGLWERVHWQRTGACPVGICLRTATPDADPGATWSYAAPFLPAGTVLPVLSARDRVDEPFVFVLTGARPPVGQPLVHAGGRHRITSVTVVLPDGTAASPRLVQVDLAACFELCHGAGHGVDVELDHGHRGRTHDFRPTLPLVIRS